MKMKNKIKINRTSLSSLSLLYLTSKINPISSSLDLSPRISSTNFYSIENNDYCNNWLIDNSCPDFFQHDIHTCNNYIIENNFSSDQIRHLVEVYDTEFPCCKRTECICSGTDMGNSFQSALLESMHKSNTGYSFSKDYFAVYKHCTIIEGNLELTHIAYQESINAERHKRPSIILRSIEQNIKLIREITGRLFISDFLVPSNEPHSILAEESLTFSELRVIRGNHNTNTNTNKKTKSFTDSLFVIEFGGKAIQFPKLSRIVKGNVNIQHCPNWCHVNNIIWKDEILINDNQKISFNTEKRFPKSDHPLEYDCNNIGGIKKGYKLNNCHVNCTISQEVAIKNNYSKEQQLQIANSCWSDEHGGYCQNFIRSFCDKNQFCSDEGCIWSRKNGASNCCKSHHGKCTFGCNNFDRKGYTSKYEYSYCSVCQYYNQNGLCRNDCKKYESNPLSYGSNFKYINWCLPKCPGNKVLDTTTNQCTDECPIGYYMNDNKQCIICELDRLDSEKYPNYRNWSPEEKCRKIKKVCPGFESVTLAVESSQENHKFQSDLIAMKYDECEVIQGNLLLNMNVLYKDAEEKQEITRSSENQFNAELKLKKVRNLVEILDKSLSNIKEITGYLRLVFSNSHAADFTGLKHFCFFRNLKIIRGVQTYANKGQSVYFQLPAKFENLCLYNLEKIEKGRIFISDNMDYDSSNLFTIGTKKQWRLYVQDQRNPLGDPNQNEKGVLNRYLNDDVLRQIPESQFTDECHEQCKYGCFRVRDRDSCAANGVKVNPCQNFKIPLYDPTSNLSNSISKRSKKQKSKKDPRYQANYRCLKKCGDASQNGRIIQYFKSDVDQNLCEMCAKECLFGCDGPLNSQCRKWNDNNFYPYQRVCRQSHHILPVDFQNRQVPGICQAINGGFSCSDFKAKINHSELALDSISAEPFRQFHQFYQDISPIIKNYDSKKDLVKKYGFTNNLEILQKIKTNNILKMDPELIKTSCITCHENCIGPCNGPSGNLDYKNGCKECRIEYNSPDSEVKNSSFDRNSIFDISVYGPQCKTYLADYSIVRDCFEAVRGDEDGECLYGCKLRYNNTGNTRDVKILSCIEVPSTSTIPIWIILGVSIPIIIVISICYLASRRRLKNMKTTLGNALTDQRAYEEHELMPKLQETGARPKIGHLRTVKESELSFGKLLGQGAFGKVYKAIWEPNFHGEKVKIIVAVKVIKAGSGATNDEILEEAGLMTIVNNKFLNRLLGICFSDDILLITAFMKGGALSDFLRNNTGTITSRNMVTWSHQIAEGMMYLENADLVHRDLATRNVLVQDINHVKITDFGLAKVLDHDNNSYISKGEKMAIKWLAPESLKSKIFTPATDVWSYGVTLWEILTFGQRPWKDVKIQHMQKVLESGERLEQPKTASLDFWLFMVKCWMKKPGDRITFKEAVKALEPMARDPDRYILIKIKRLTEVVNSYKDFNELNRGDLIEEFGDAVQGTALDQGIVLTDAQKIDEYLRPEEDLTNPDANNNIMPKNNIHQTTNLIDPFNVAPTNARASNMIQPMYKNVNLTSPLLDLDSQNQMTSHLVDHSMSGPSMAAYSAHGIGSNLPHSSIMSGPINHISAGQSHNNPLSFQQYNGLPGNFSTQNSNLSSSVFPSTARSTYTNPSTTAKRLETSNNINHDEIIYENQDVLTEVPEISHQSNNFSNNLSTQIDNNNNTNNQNVPLGAEYSEAIHTVNDNIKTDQSISPTAENTQIPSDSQTKMVSPQPDFFPSQNNDKINNFSNNDSIISHSMTGPGYQSNSSHPLFIRGYTSRTTVPDHQSLSQDKPLVDYTCRTEMTNLDQDREDLEEYAMPEYVNDELADLMRK